MCASVVFSVFGLCSLGGGEGGGEFQVCFEVLVFFKDGFSIVSGDSLFHFSPSILFFTLYYFSSLDSVSDGGFKEG